VEVLRHLVQHHYLFEVGVAYGAEEFVFVIDRVGHGAGSLAGKSGRGGRGRRAEIDKQRYDPTPAEPGWGIVALFAHRLSRSGSGSGVFNDGMDFQLDHVSPFESMFSKLLRAARLNQMPALR